MLRVRTKTYHNSVVRQEKGSRRACAKRQVRNSTDEALELITSACLKHSDCLKIDNWIEMCLTADVIKQLRHVKSTRRSSVRISDLGTTHPDDSDTIRRDRHPCLLHFSIRTPEPADTARESDFQVTLWCIHQRDSLQYPLSQALFSHLPKLPAARVL